MKKLKLILSLAGVLALGVYFGIGVTTHNVVTPESKQKAMGLADRQADGSFVLANFERPGDFKIWKFISASMLPSAERVQEGGLSARVTFHAGDRMSAILLEDFARRKDFAADWSGFRGLRFHIFNPDYEKRKLTLLVTDTAGSRYAHELELPERVWQDFEIPVSEMAAVLNCQKIDALSLAMHPVKTSQQFYLDDVRLVPAVPKGHGPVSEQAAGTASAAGPVRMFDYGFSKRRAAWTVRDPETKQSFVRVPFIVKNEVPSACNDCPVDGGVPFPMGELTAPVRLRLLDATGKALPFQTRILATWPDQSVRWLGLHFETSLAPGEIRGFVIEYGPGIAAPDFPGDLDISETADEIRVNTRQTEAVFSKKSFFLFDRVSFDRNRNGVMEADEAAVSKAKLTLGFRGKEFRTDLDKQSYQIGIEEKGRQRAVIKASGWYQSQDGMRYCQAIVRYTFYQGKSFVKVAHTLIYTGYPENRADTSFRLLKLPDNETIETYGMVLPYSFAENQGQVVRIGKMTPEVLELSGERFCRLLQLDWEKANVETGAGAMFPEQAYAGWLDVSDNAQGITVAVRDFRENFPKGLAADSGRGEIQIDLWPREAGDLDLATTEDAKGPDTKGTGQAFGLAKTHEILLDFHPRFADAAQTAARAHGFKERLIPRVNPYWVDATGALGRLYPADDPRFRNDEEMLARLFDWAARQPKDFRWYGMLNYGDTLSWWRDADEDAQYTEYGWHPVGRWGWYNCEAMGTHTGALLQYVRSGEWRYFEFGENLSRHLMDVDTIHYNTIAADKRLRGSLNERYSQVGSMHRHNANHWGDVSDECSHTSVVGLMVYYYLTGDERVLDVIKEIGEYYLTEPFAYARRFYLVPQRTLANALWGDVLLYELTWDERYKKAADRIVNLFLKGQQSDGSFLENYNRVMRKWGGKKSELFMTAYTVGALIAYHELTQNTDVLSVLLKVLQYLPPTEYSGEKVLHGYAYAYWVTGEPLYIHLAKDNLRKIHRYRKTSPDPLIDGMIYAKSIYHPPMEFLATVPYVFAALADADERERNSVGSQQ